MKKFPELLSGWRIPIRRVSNLVEARGPSRPRASYGTWALAIVVALALTGSMAKARRKKPRRAGLPARIHQLILKAYGLSLDEAKPTTDQIQALVLSHLDTWIQNRAPSFVEVRRELEREFGTLRYPFYDDCSAFSAPWKGGQILGAGYSVGWSEYDRVNVVALYQTMDHHTRRVAVTHFVPRTNLNYIVVSPDSAGNFRLFIWGTRPGKAEPRLTAILYAFDGQHLKPLWEKKDVYDGKLAVEGHRVILTSVNEAAYVNAVQQNTLPHRHEAFYELTSQGLKFESERDIPF